MKAAWKRTRSTTSSPGDASTPTSAIPAPRDGRGEETESVERRLAPKARRLQIARIAMFAIPVAMLALLVLAGFVDGFTRELVLRGLRMLGPAAFVIGIWAHRPRNSSPWWAAFAGLLVWALADLFNSYEALTGHRLTVEILGVELTWFAVFTMAGYLPLIAATFAWGNAQWRNRRLEANIDSAILLVGLGILGWAIAIQPALALAGVAQGDRVEMVFYPVADILLLGAMARLLSRVAHSPSLTLVFGAAGAILAADITTGISHLSQTPPTLLSSMLWFVAGVLVSIAALHPSMSSLTDSVVIDDNRLTVPRIVFMTMGLMCPPVALAIRLMLGHSDVAPYAVAIAASSVLVLLRIALLVRGIQRQSVLLDQLASTDHLTDLPNRRSADLMLASALINARRGDADSATPVVLAMIDLDHFKQLNDGLGHLAGDRLLSIAAQRWKEQLKENQALTRYGGEEFVLISAGYPLEEVAETVRAMRAATPMRQTFSAGIATWDGVETGDSLIGRADGAMYLAKERGRACTVVTGGRSTKSARGENGNGSRGELRRRSKRALDARAGGHPHRL